MATPVPKSRTAAKRKPRAATGTPEPTLGSKLKLLRRASRLSQEAIGAQGFVSTPGWIKIENGQRNPSEKLLTSFVSFLVDEEVIQAKDKDALFRELCALKFIHDRREFLRQMARDYHKSLAPIVILATLPEVD